MKTNRSCASSRIELLEARIAPAAVLVTSDVTFKLPSLAVPGDTGSVTFTIKNTGDQPFNDTSGIHVQLSPGNDNNPLDDRFVAEFEDQRLSIAKGGSVKKTLKFTLPALTLPNPTIPAGDYYVVVDVRQANNYDHAPSPFSLVFKFGQVGSRNVQLDATDGAFDGDRNATNVSFILSGKGTGTLTPTGGVVNMSFTGTDKSSAAGMSGGGGDGLIVLNDISADATMNKLAMLQVDARGNLSFPQGFAKGIQLHDIGVAGATDHALTIGADAVGKPINLVFRKVTEMDFNVTPGIGALRVNEWLDNNADPDVLTAKFIDKMATVETGGTSGDFAANLSVATGNDKGVGLNSAKIAGKLHDAVWTFGSANPIDVGSITAGDTTNWRFTATGDGGDIALDSLHDTGLGNDVSLEAQTFGQILVGGVLEATIIRANGVDAKGFAIREFEAGDVNTLAQLTAPAGGIGKIGVHTWTAPISAIDAKFIGVLSAKGTPGDNPEDFTPSLNLTATPDQLPKGTKGSITSAFLVATATGSWQVAADVLSLAASTTASGWQLTGSPTHSTLKKLLIGQDMNGAVNMADFPDIDVHGILAASLTAHDAGKSFGSVTAKYIDGANFSAPGSIGSIEADGRWKNSVVIASDLGLARSRGEMTLVNFYLSGSTGAEEVLVGGAMTSVHFTNTGGHTMKAISAGSWTGGGVDGGAIKAMSVRGDLTNTNFTLAGATPGAADLETLSVVGKLSGTKFSLSHRAGKIAVGGMYSSEFVVTGDDISTFEVRGLGANIAAFSASKITANAVKILTMRDVDASTVSTVSLDSVTLYKRLDGKVLTTVLHDLDATQANADQVGQYALNIR